MLPETGITIQALSRKQQGLELPRLGVHDVWQRFLSLPRRHFANHGSISSGFNLANR
jgi:hypothetical protein